MERGRVEVFRFDSEVLAGNPLGDPAEREVHVYLPPGHEGGGAPLPALLALSGFTGTGASRFRAHPLTPSLDDRLDRMIAAGDCPPVVVAAPDCFTRLGGSQYVNSSAVGRYEDYLVSEVVPEVSRRYSAGPWGVFGNSSGGYGAVSLGLRHPGVFRALADHSGDANFELCYLPDCGKALTAFREAGGPAAWLDGLWADVNRSRKKYHAPFNMLAMAACYSPNPDSPHLGIDFPFDLDTGEFRPEVWERWREADPVRLARRFAENAGKLAGAFIDCGRHDEFNLQWGARALASALREAGAPVRHEEYDDGHFGISYRIEVSIPYLVEALARLT